MVPRRLPKGPPLGRLRFATVDDCPIIMEMLTESMTKNFRIEAISDIVYMIESGILSVCQLDINEKIVGFLSVRDYPIIPSVHPHAWEQYVWTKYKAIQMNSRNTLFIQLLAWEPSYSRDIVDRMLKSVFMHDSYVDYIAMIKSLTATPLLIPGHSAAEGSFKRFQTVERGVPADKVPWLSVAERSEVCPRLKIRRAVEEDNDDIIPIIERHSARLRELYGDYYVSELISRHPDSERVLMVCEHKEVAVGVMCLNTQINYEALEESFELSPFAGLRRMSVSPFSNHSQHYSEHLDSDNLSAVVSNTYLGGQMETQPRSDDKARVTWLFDQEDFKYLIGDRDDKMTYSTAPQSSTPPGQLDILNLLEDEDEFEFDIINIDTDLLRVPKYLSYDYYDFETADNIMKTLDPKRFAPEEKKPKDKCTNIGKKEIVATFQPVRYHGPPNAFLLELFAMSEDYDEKYGFDMLESAFEIFPDRDYCVICLPSHHAAFPLLEHFTLVTPYSVCPKFINESLYVAHVNSVRGKMMVRPGEAYDIDALYNVLEHAPRISAILELFESAIYSNSLQPFVFLCQNQPIGMAVLGPLEGGTSVRTQYDLEPEPRRPGTDGFILSSVMSPVMDPHSRWFLRELLRHSQYSTLFWICRLFAKGDGSPSRNLMSLAGHMAPVHPRAKMPNISGNRDLDKLYKDGLTPFALWVLERPLTGLPKVYVNNAIVVVGASRTGLAFIESLLLGPTSQYLTFSNITLVSEHGLPTVSECLRAAITAVPKDGRFTDRYLKSVPFYFYIDVMSAVMVGIDRKRKCIQLKGGGEKYYDELVLTCGKQFQHPDHLREPLEHAKGVELVRQIFSILIRGEPCVRILMDNPKYQPDKVPLPPEMPDNVMVINSIYQANICLRKLLKLITDNKDTEYVLSTENRLLVYGECIEAYSCIAALLELGISPQMISFIEPFPPDDPRRLRVNCFNNETVDERVQQSIEDLGITVYRKCSLASWKQRGTHVEALHLMSCLNVLYVPCFALFYYGLRAIDINAFKAINECNLVYDGGLVTGPMFDTNDPHVFAAGTCVKYSRRLYADTKIHNNYCSEDVGEELARMFLKKLDPLVIGDSQKSDAKDVLPRYSSTILAQTLKSSSVYISNSFSDSSSSIIDSCILRPFCMTNRKWQPVLRFDSPIVESATLPGPLYYMKLRKPGAEIPMEVQLSLPHQGHTLMTDVDNRFFRLQINNLHCIDAITCLSDTEFSTEILVQLYGKHEAFFNKLLTRYQMGDIKDLYEFFTQPWMSAVYQETFPELLQEIKNENVGTSLMTVCMCEVHNLLRESCPVDSDDEEAAKLMFEESLVYMPCALTLEEAQSLRTFREVVDRFVAKKSTMHLDKDGKPTDIPSVCGQSRAIRSHTEAFWKIVDGDRLVVSHLARYLNRHTLTNPHYAHTDPDFI